MNVLRGILDGISRRKQLLMTLFLLVASFTTFGATKTHASGGCCTGIGIGGRRFVHTSTSANRFSFTTVIDENEPLTPKSKLFVTSLVTAKAVSDPHPLGVWYTGRAWIIFNEDRAPMPVGAVFNVWADPSGNDGDAVTITSTSSTTLGDFFILDTPIPHAPDASVIVTANFGTTQVYNPHFVGVFSIGNSWAIFNEDRAPMPVGATFNVVVFNPHYVTVTPGVNSDENGSSVFIDNSNFNNSPGLLLLVTPRWDPNQVDDPHPLEVQFFLGRWIIWHADGTVMPPDASFNVVAAKFGTD